MKTRFVQLMSLTLMLTLLTALVGGVGAQEDYKILRTGLHNLSGDIATLDPNLAEDVPSNQAILMIFPGLTNNNEITAAPEPGTAESWDVSEDGLTYTFHIRPNIYWVKYNPDTEAVEQVMDENGEPRTLKASDYVYGIKRSLDPETASPYGSILLPWIVGAEAYNSGTGSADDVMVTAVDDLTLEIVSPSAAPFLPTIYGMWVARATPQWLIDEYGPEWIEQDYIETYGPYALKEWLHDESLTLIKNPFWEGTDYMPAAKIDEVYIPFLDKDVQLANYEAGDLDAAEVPAGAIERIQADPVLSAEFNIGADACTYYYGFAVEKEPFTDARVRRAFSMAIDRQGIIDNILKAGQTPAGMFTRPDIFAAPNQEDYPDDAIFTDVEAAKAELQAYLDEKGITVADLPPITLMYNTSELHASIAQAVQQMWKDAFGIEVQLASQDFAVFLDTRKNDPPQIFRAAWCWDYPDANSFLKDVMYSTSAQNDQNWYNDAFDALVDEALTITDEAARRDLYAQAERLLVKEDAAMAPIYYYTTQQITKPYVERTYSVIALERYEKWDMTPQ